MEIQLVQSVKQAWSGLKFQQEKMYWAWSSLGLAITVSCLIGSGQANNSRHVQVTVFLRS